MATQNKNLLVGIAVIAIVVLGFVFLNPANNASGSVLVYGSVDAEDMQSAIDAFHAENPDITIE